MQDPRPRARGQPRPSKSNRRWSSIDGQRQTWYLVLEVLEVLISLHEREGGHKFYALHGYPTVVLFADDSTILEGID